MGLSSNRPGGLGLDRVGAVLSALCAVHCLAAPLVLILAPALVEWWEHPLTHLVLAVVILPVATIALGRGAMLHRNRGVIGLGIVGVGLISAALAMEGFAAGTCAVPGSGAEVAPCCIEPGEEGAILGLSKTTAISAGGGVLLAIAHVLNLRCCNRGRCAGS